VSTRTSTTTTLALHASRIVIDVGVLMVLGAMSLPFVTTAAGNRTAMELDALPALLLVAPIFLMTMLPDQTRPLPRPVSYGALLLGLIAFPYALLKYLDSVVLSRTLDGGLGLGVRMLVFGTFVVVAGIAIGLTRAFMGLATSGQATRRVAAPRRAGVTSRRQRARATTEAPTEVRQPAPRPEPAAVSAPRQPAPAPAPAPAAPPKSQPARASKEVSPFGEPLFDSLEIPAAPTGTAPRRQPGLVFGGTGAAERVAEHAPDDDPDAPSSRE
jgi:hypothetical protein